MIPVDSVTQLHKKKSRAYIAKCLRESDNAINAICASPTPPVNAGAHLAASFSEEVVARTPLDVPSSPLDAPSSPLDAPANVNASGRGIHEKCGCAYFCCGN